MAGFQKTNFGVSSAEGAGNTKIGFIMRIADEAPCTSSPFLVFTEIFDHEEPQEDFGKVLLCNTFPKSSWFRVEHKALYVIEDTEIMRDSIVFNCIDRSICLSD